MLGFQPDGQLLEAAVGRTIVQADGGAKQLKVYRKPLLTNDRYNFFEVSLRNDGNIARFIAKVLLKGARVYRLD